jgi:hypothetical protein
MIRKSGLRYLVHLAALLVLAPLVATGEETQAQKAVSDRAAGNPAPGIPSSDPLKAYQLPFDTLLEQTVGSASRAVRFDWRKSTASLGLMGGQVLELNNFTSERIGAFLRTPVGPFLGEFGVGWVFTSGSAASDQLSLTPYRQLGRPSRLELNFDLGLPIAEGVVTPRFGFLPAAELVFSANAELRYLYYPGELTHANFGQVAGAIFSPSLTQLEIDNLNSRRLPGMQVSTGRYNLLTGLSLDVYLHNGLFLAPRMMVALPIFALGSADQLGWWWELNLGVGWTF